MRKSKGKRLKKELTSINCLHLRIEEERHFGKLTGNKVCAECGRTIYMSAGEKSQQQ